MEEQKRQFQGIWIPKEIWLDKRLTALDKIILMEINSLDDEETGCFASNQYLADFCQCTETKVSTTISKLKELGYIKLENFNGRIRVLKIETLPLKNLKSAFKKIKHNNINNNIDDNKEIYKERFETFYKNYPRKVGKSDAEKWFKKNKPNEELFNKMLLSLEKHKKSKQWQTKEYIPYPATWLNGKRWEDELEEIATEIKEKKFKIVEENGVYKKIYED